MRSKCFLERNLTACSSKTALVELNLPLETCLILLSLMESQTSTLTEKQRHKVTAHLTAMIVSLVITKWQVHQNSAIKKKDPRDFKKLNKMSLRGGSVTAKDQYQFRATHDARIPFGVTSQKQIMLPEESHTYGKRNRPQTPVGSIIQNHYGETSAAEL